MFDDTLSAIDPSLWITCYDLPADRKDEYLDWLHGVYLPRILARPGVVHAAHYASVKPGSANPRMTTDPAVPPGSDYVLVVAGQSAHVFANSAAHYLGNQPDPSPAGLELTPHDKGMLALRRGARVSITTEVARAHGPQASTRAPAGTLAPCIQLGSFNAADVDAEDEVLAWYAHWRMPAFRTVAGCVGIRKLVTASGWAKHVVLYEFTSLQSRGQYASALKALSPEMFAWNERAIARLTHAPGSPLVAQRLWPVVD